ncbi:MAG: DUF2236 domain-containing protein [Actinomycetales bacterium]|nr:DUF2236 domain-containing protein [Actinomycetales bacterium]
MTPSPLEGLLPPGLLTGLLPEWLPKGLLGSGALSSGLMNPLQVWLGMLPEPQFVFGAPDSQSADPGLFGPESVSWQVHADPIALIGGVRALLLQALHPEAMAGVAKWSDYREDPWGRLTRTAEYIGITTFGTADEANAAGAKVRGVHARLGVDAPHLLLWVHAGFVDSLLHVHRLAHPGFSDADADAYVDEQRRAAELVGLDADSVFATAAELADYFEQQRPGLSAGADALTAARVLVAPPMSAQVQLLTPARGAWSLVASTAFASLPLWAQRLYAQGLGLPDVPAGLAPIIEASVNATAALRDASISATVRGIRVLLATLPESARTGPHVQAARMRLGL